MPLNVLSQNFYNYFGLFFDLHGLSCKILRFIFEAMGFSWTDVLVTNIGIPLSHFLGITSGFENELILTFGKVNTSFDRLLTDYGTH